MLNRNIFEAGNCSDLVRSRYMQTSLYFVLPA